MEKIIKPIKINRLNFNMYGDLISTNDINPIDINAGYAKRFDNLADLNTSKDGGKTIVSIFSSLKRTFPMKIDMMEKHPLGSQAFIPILGGTINDSILLISGLMPGGATKDKKVVSFIGINAWLPKGCFSIISIFIGNLLFFALKILTIAFPFFF